MIYGKHGNIVIAYMEKGMPVYQGYRQFGDDFTDFEFNDTELVLHTDDGDVRYEKDKIITFRIEWANEDNNPFRFNPFREVNG